MIKTFLKLVLNILLSLRTSLWLLAAALVLLFAGAVIMPGSQEFQKLHFMTLFSWLQNQSIYVTWWIWGLIFVLAVLSVNTVFCSVESLLNKRKATQWLLLISPQIIHAGALFVLFAHLLSSAGASQHTAVAMEGSKIGLSKDNTVLKVKAIDIDLDYYGYITDWEVGIEYISDGKPLKQDKIRPNSPSTQTGFNINVKDIRAHPARAVLLQINREPGAVWALTGALLFSVGIIILVILKIRQESPDRR